MHCPDLDAWARAYVGMLKNDPSTVEEVRARLRKGEKGKQIQSETGVPQNLISIVRQALDPASDTSKRLAAWREWREWKDAQTKEKRVRHLMQVRAKAKERELRTQLWDGKESYETFIKKMRGEVVPKKRIALLDYSDVDEENAERHKNHATPKLYRKILRELLPAKARAEILVRLAQSEDEGVALRAMQILHRLEGIERKPKEARPDPAGGPMFSLAEGVGVGLHPVMNDGETKH